VRYYYQPALQLLALGLLALGGAWLWLIPTTIFFLTLLIDDLSPDFEQAEEPSIYSDIPLLLTALLVLIVTAVFVMIASASLGTASWDTTSVQTTGLVSQGGVFEPQPLWALAGGTLGIGMLMAAAFNIGHELSHRQDNKLHLLIGQVICTLSLHSCFPIEHVYGHHKNIGTHLDPTTARRNEPFWLFIGRSFLGTYRNAFRIAHRRASRHRGIMRFLKNRAIHGMAIQGALFAAVFALGGWAGLVAYFVATLVALIIMELFQYVGHYGLVRVPGTPVRAAHAWELSGQGSSSFTVNLTCHSDHHISGQKPFWQLRLTHQAPTLPYGPFPVLALAMIPPLYFKITKPALEQWDRNLATPEERALAASMLHAQRHDRGQPSSTTGSS
jgi:alkane 1-monooxygenase